MARGKRVTPKKQKEILNSLIDPHLPSYGNPNTNIQGNLNRGTQMSFKDDDNKLFQVGIKDIDESMFYYFENVISPFVYQNGERISVPIIYGSPERWKSLQKDGYYRDKNGKIMNPIIMIKRNNLAKDRSIGNKLDANNPYNYGIYSSTYSKDNAYNQFAILNNRVPDKKYYAVVIPDYVTIDYSCMIQTYYVEQLNKIVEAINYASDSYWGNPEKFQFRARIDNFTTVNELNNNVERSVRSNFNIKLRGYIVPDALQKELNSEKKFYAKSKVVFSVEASSNPDIYTGKTENGRVVTPNFQDKEAQKRSTGLG